MDSQETAADSYSTSTRHFSHGVRNLEKEPTKGGRTPRTHKTTFARIRQTANNSTTQHLHIDNNIPKPAATQHRCCKKKIKNEEKDAFDRHGHSRKRLARNARQNTIT